MAQELKTFSDIYTAVIEALRINSSDTTSINKVKRFINMVYVNMVVPHKDWWWLNGTTTVIAENYHAAGTVEVTKDSASITFSSAPVASKEGEYFSVDGTNEIYKITSHTAGETSATLETQYVGASNSTANYRVWTYKINLPTDCKEVKEVYHERMRHPMQPTGMQEFRRMMSANRKAEGYPAYYHIDDFYDPSSGDGETESDRYRQMWIYPSLDTARTPIHIDYVKQVDELDATTDEPVMPLEDRIVLYYGALEMGWRYLIRNTEEANIALRQYEAKLANMAGDIRGNGSDTPRIAISGKYARSKRRGARGLRAKSDKFAWGVDSGASSFTDTPDRAAQFDATTGRLEASSVTTTELGYLDGVTSNVQTQLDAKVSGAPLGNNPRVLVNTGNGEASDSSDVSVDELSYLENTEKEASATLTDNTSSATAVDGFSYDASSFNAIQVDYLISRSTDREVGSLVIVNDGSSNVEMSRSGIDLGTDPGVTFTVAFSSTNVILKYTTTNTGNDATFEWKAQKL